MTRYQSSSQAPALLAAAIKLGVSGVTAASTEAAKLAAIHKLMDDTAAFTNLETNVFLEHVLEKVLIQTLFQRMQFIDPLSKAFFKEGVNMSAAKEIIDNRLLSSQTFDPNKRFPDDQKKAKTLVTILTTTKKAYITNTVSMVQVRAAFVSEQAFGEWMSKQVELLRESLQIEMFETLTPIITGAIKNTITLAAADIKGYDDLFVAINGISLNMAKIPSAQYNLGFTDATTATNAADSRKQITPRADQILLMSTNLTNRLEGEVQTVKFNNAYFKTEGYGDVINIPSAETEIYLIDKRAFEGYFRINEIATQTWAANLTTEFFLHYWYVFGAIPWANGVKIKFTTPTKP